MVAPAPAVPFEWTAPAECPASADVRASVERHLGSTLEEVALTSWSVAGTITRDDADVWSVVLAIETPDGRSERTLTDPADCAAVSEAAALLVALALDPEAVASTSEGTTASTDTPKPTATPVETKREEPVVVPDLRAKEPPRERPLYFGVGAVGGFDWGTLRSVSPIARGSFAWLLPKMRVGVNATFGVAPGFRVPPITRDISLWMWTVGAEAGPVFRVKSFEFPVMIGLEAGQLSIRPRVILDPTRQQVTWAALLLSPGIAWVAREWFALVFNVSTVVSFVRPEFAIQGVGRIAAPAPVGIRANLGVEFRFRLSVIDRG